MIPSAKIAILLPAPPAKTLNIPNKPFWFPSIIVCNCSIIETDKISVAILVQTP